MAQCFAQLSVLDVLFAAVALLLPTSLDAMVGRPLMVVGQELSGVEQGRHRVAVVVVVPSLVSAGEAGESGSVGDSGGWLEELLDLSSRCFLMVGLRCLVRSPKCCHHLF